MCLAPRYGVDTPTVGVVVEVDGNGWTLFPYRVLVDTHHRKGAYLWLEKTHVSLYRKAGSSLVFVDEISDKDKNKDEEAVEGGPAAVGDLPLGVDRKTFEQDRFRMESLVSSGRLGTGESEALLRLLDILPLTL